MHVGLFENGQGDGRVAVVDGEDGQSPGFDGIKISRQVYPKLCTVKQDAKKLGEYSAKRLLDLIENKNAEANYAKIVKGTLIKGESIAKLKR